MKFKFRLESFLKLVRLREDRKRMELGYSRRRIQHLENALQSQGTRLRDSLSGTPANRDLTLWMSFYAQSALGAMDTMKEVESSLTDEEDREQMARMGLAEVAAKRQGLENLREQSLKSFRRQSDKKEQKEDEEIFRNFKRVSR